jgi:hypothetical protein
MNTYQLLGKYSRLRGELNAAYAEQAWALGSTGRIDRIAKDLAEIESILAAQGLSVPPLLIGESTPALERHAGRLTASC